MKKFVLFAVIPFMLSTVSCKQKSTEDNFDLWAENCNPIKVLKEYVEDVTNEKSKNFIPVEDRIVTFDMDGTLYGELYPVYLEYCLLEYRALDDANYTASESVKAAGQAIRDHYTKGEAYPDNFPMVHAQAQAEAFAGLTLKEFDTYVANFLKRDVWGFENLTFGEGFYKPMAQVMEYLQKNDFDCYVVSGSDRFICRTLLCSNEKSIFNIEPSHVIGMDVELKSKDQGDTDPLNYLYKANGDDVVRTDKLLIKNLKMNKVKQIATDIGKIPVLSFGNSDGDSSMHNYALSNSYKSAAFMLIADNEREDYGNKIKAEALKTKWEEANYTVISMDKDFKTIYGTSAKKVTK